MLTKIKSIRRLVISSSLALVSLFSFVLLRHVPVVKAVDSNLTNGITVDSTLDTPDDNIGDGICDDGGGNCTFRAAIQEANSNADVSTILFNISGAGDFTNGGQNGYTIEPQTELPGITEQVTINAYSQPGSLINTAVAPNPLNGRLLIELDGSEAGNADGLSFEDDADGSVVRGLVVNSWDESSAILVLADNIVIQGCYIGTNVAGLLAKPNQVGINSLTGDPESGEDALIGGLNPEDRDVISGNTAGSIGTASYPGTGWVFQGNYLGVAVNGLTAIANSTLGGSGILSIDYASDNIVGGSQPGAINIFGASLGHGIAPHEADNLLIEGNYIGLGYNGATLLGSNGSGEGSGLALSGSNGVVFKNNKVAGWSDGGVQINAGNSDVLIEGNSVYDNDFIGVGVVGSSDVLINDNHIYDNALANMTITGLSLFGQVTNSVRITANNIGLLPSNIPADGNANGIVVTGDVSNLIIGGASNGDSNVVAASNGANILVSKYTSQTLGISMVPSRISILGNSISDAKTLNSGPLAGPGLGIDLIEGLDTDSTPDGQPNTYSHLGPDANDSSDPDTGPNNYINFPVLNSVTQEGAQATISFNLDAVSSPANLYRVEFFANDTADPSGYGEGQTYLGSTTVSNGNNQQATITLPNGTNLTGKQISATTTAVDATTDLGFGSTSEFSHVVAAAVTSTSGAGDQLALTGVNIAILTAFASLLILTAGAVLSRRTS